MNTLPKELDTLRQALCSGARCIVVTGAAGTGKTTLVKGLLPIIRELGLSPLLAAPTGRAAKVLEQRTGCQARTIHSTIYQCGDVPEEDTDGLAVRWRFRIREETPPSTVMIVDEASMVGFAVRSDEHLVFGTGSLLSDLVSFLGVRRPECRNALVFVGDPFQLPPVGEGNGVPPALRLETLARLVGTPPVEIRLETVHRQAGDSGILLEAEAMRASRARGDYGRFSLHEHPDVSFVRSPDPLRDYHPEKGLSDKIVIAQTNEAVRSYNAAVRRMLGRTEAFPVAGERLVSLRNTRTPHEALSVDFMNGDFLEVVSDSGEGFSETGYYREKGGTETVAILFSYRKLALRWCYEADRPPVEVWANVTPLLSDKWRESGPKANIALYNAVRSRLRAKHPGVSREEMANLLKTDVFLNAPVVDFGYAVTCHKAQGGEWDDAWVDYRHTEKASTEGFFRWAYTATTRARRRLHVICAPVWDALTAVLGARIAEVAAAPRPVPVPDGGIAALLARFGLRGGGPVPRPYAVRIPVTDSLGGQAGYVDLFYRGNRRVSGLSVHLADSAAGAALQTAAQCLGGTSIDLALGGTPVAPVAEPPKPAAAASGEVLECHAETAARVLAAAEKAGLRLTGARSLTPFQLRFLVESELGAGYADFYFDKRRAVTNMGSNGVSAADLQKLNGILAHGE